MGLTNSVNIVRKKDYLVDREVAGSTLLIKRLLLILIYLLLFYRIHARTTAELSKLALDLLNTATNSVPSERAFSAINFLKSKARNRLRIEAIDKRYFIYINTRSLRVIAEGEGGSKA